MVVVGHSGWSLGSDAGLLAPASLSDSWTTVYEHLLPHSHPAMNSAMPVYLDGLKLLEAMNQN